MVNVLITGSKGRLGKIVDKKLRQRGHKTIPFNRGDNIGKLLDKKIDVILNLAGNYTQDVNEAIRDNVSLPNNMLRLAREKKSKILLIGSLSILYKLTNYSLSKAILNTLANEYQRLGVDVTIINPPEIYYKKDNIISRIKEKAKKEGVVVDNLDFEYVDANELAIAIVNYVETGVMDIQYNNKNLLLACKNVKNIKKGITKNYVVHDEYGVLLQYIQKL